MSRSALLGMVETHLHHSALLVWRSVLLSCIRVGKKNFVHVQYVFNNNCDVLR